MSASATPLNQADRFAHIDALRAFAVLLVVVAHAGLGHIVPGGSGVTIFFSISGFIITYLLLRERDKTGGFSVGGFYFRRAAKIFPPFLLIVILPTLVYSIWSPISWRDFSLQVFFLFNWIAPNHDAVVLPGSAVVWSLSIEEQFYIVFALIWIFMVRSTRWRIALTITAAAVAFYSLGSRILLAADPDLVSRIYYGTDTRIGGIALGVLTAVIYHSWSTRESYQSRFARLMSNDWMLIGAVVLYLASLLIRDQWFRDTFRFSFQGVAACAVILYGMLPGSGPLRRIFIAVATWRPIAIIGLASYSIYLAHLTLLRIIEPLIVDLPLAFQVVCISVIGIGVGIGIYYLVEVPVHRWRATRRSKVSEQRVAR